MAKQANIEVIINSEEAKRRFDELKGSLIDIKNKRDQAFAKGDVGAFKVYDKELKDVNKEMRQFKTSANEVENALKNINKISPKDLEIAFKKAREELRATARDAENLGSKQSAFKRLQQEMDKVNGTMRSQSSWFAKAGDGFNRYFGLATTAIASFTGVFLGLKQTITDFNEYQAKVANLSALTGLKGDDLDWISKRAKELSTTITEEGVRITQGADVIVDAFTKMGSAKPELLNDKEALAETTKQAIILSEAAKMELAPAVDGLALTMNQFGAGAKEASRYVNVLAAGSKAGAAEIPDISAAIVKFGAAAKTANVSVEESVGLIEALSEKGIKGEIAGTGLKTMLVKMMAGADEFNPKVVGMQQSLENLSKANLSAAELTKMFGLENFTVVKSLIDSKDRVNELTKAVTGTNVAYEQANINTDTNAAKLEQQKNKIKLISIELGEKLAPIMSSSLGIFTKFMQAIISTINFYGQHSRAINSTIIMIGTYIAVMKAQAVATTIKNKVLADGTKALSLENAVLKLNSILNTTARISTLLFAAAKALLTGNIIRARAAMLLLNKTIGMSPWGLALIGVTAVALAIYNLTQKTSEAVKFQKKLNERLAEEKSELASLGDSLNKAKMGSEERKELIDKMNTAYGKYLPNLLTEASSTEDVATALKIVNRELERKVLNELKSEGSKELMKEKLKLYQEEIFAQRELEDLNKKLNPNSGYKFGSIGLKVQAIDRQKALPIKIGALQYDQRQIQNQLNDFYDMVQKEIDKIPAPDTKKDLNSAKEGDTKNENGVEFIFKNGKWVPKVNKNNNDDNKEWSLNADAAFNRAKLELQKKRLNDEIKTDEELNDLILALEIKTLQDRLRLTTLSVKQRGDLEQQLVDKQLTAKNNQIKKIEDAEKVRLDAQKKLIEDTAKNNEKALNDLKIKNNEEFASITSLEQAKLLLKDSMSADELKKITNLYDAKQELRKKYDKDEQQLAILQNEALLRIFEDIASKGMIGPMGNLSPEQQAELQEKIEKLKQQIAEMKAAASVGEKQEKGSEKKELKQSKVDIFGFSQDDWLILFDNLKQGKVGVEELAMVANSMIDIWKSYSEIVAKTEQKELNTFIKNQDKKKNALTKRLDQGRVSEESYNASVRAIESETERRKAIMERNQAKRERDIALMSAIVNTASAMVSSLKTDPTGILATAIGIMGGIQISKILATQLPEIPGAETGGNIMDVIRSQDGKKFRAKNDPTKRGFVNSPTIITGENGNEYIMPEEALRNPTIRNMIDFIETARLNGSLSRINLPMIQQIAGRETGGFASSSKTTSEIRTETTIYREQTAQLNEFTEVMKQVRDVFSKPIKAETYLRGKGGIYEAQKEDQQLKKNATL